MQPSSTSSSCSSSPSLPLFLLSSLFLLLLTSTPSSALPHPPLGRDHKPRDVQPRDLFSELNSTLSSVVSTLTSVAPTSPRPTPEAISGGLARLVASYKALSIDDLVNFATLSTGCYDSSSTATLFNNLFVAGGANTTILLCPGQVINIDKTILFTASGQGIQTQGGSAVSLANQATLKITSSSISTAIQACGLNCNDLLIDSIKIDGGRGALGPLTSGAALLELGGTSQRHTVSNCQLTNTRGWSSLHLIQGTNLACSGAIIKNNVIGPSGTEDVIADGISLACQNSIVQDNTIFDATDGGIVIFGSPGSDVSRNTITSSSSILLGGINLVDNSPFGGNYTGVLVHDNTITASGAQIKVGIAMGPAIWSPTNTNVNRGASVYKNTFGGQLMSFALGVAGVNEWSVKDNVATPDARFNGVRGSRCASLSASVTPSFAILNPETSTVSLGDDANCWTAGSIQYLICYESGDSTDTVSPDAAFTGGTCTAPAPMTDSTTSNWKNSGYCLNDNPDIRILANDYSNSANQSVEVCTSRCASLQYAYAGMENSKQCYCSNTIDTSVGQGAQYNATTSCQSICPGNSSERCGGNSYLMSLWYDAAMVSAPVVNTTLMY